MYRSEVELRYMHDGVTRRVVDQMRALLGMYHITPSELREAAMLAATMHEAQRVRPLLVSKPLPWGGMQVFIDEAQFIPPAMFGGSTADGKPLYDTVTGRMPSNGSTVTQVEKQKTAIAAVLNEHRHVFYYAGRKKDYNICDCGISDTYYNWEYNKK